MNHERERNETSVHLVLEDVGICKLQTGQSIVLLVTENKDAIGDREQRGRTLPLVVAGKSTIELVWQTCFAGLPVRPTVLWVYGV